MLEETRQKLSPITIFSSTQITLGPLYLVVDPTLKFVTS